MRTVVIDVLMLALGMIAVKILVDATNGSLPGEVASVFNYFKTIWPG